MVRETENHGWAVPEQGDQSWQDLIDDLADEIDNNVPIDPDEPPTAGEQGRIIVNRHTNRDTPVMQYDDGVSLRQIKAAQRWDVHDVLWKSRFQSVIAQWEFTEPLIADVTGNAGFVAHADHAEHTAYSEQLDGYTADEYAVTTVPLTVGGSYSFDSPTVFEDGMEINSGTLSLPVYDEPPADGESTSLMSVSDIETTDDEPAVTASVTTGDAIEVSQNSVTLRGELLDMGDETMVYAGFRLRKRGDDGFDIVGPLSACTQPRTVYQSYPTANGYASELLEPGETYEYQMVARETRESPGVTGETRAFTLVSGSEQNDEISEDN